MADFSINDLAALPTPEVIQSLDAESILTRRKDKFLSICSARGIPYDVSTLESDPAIALLEEGSYEDLILRALGNDIARQRYLYYASGAALDHMAAFYDVVRLSGETDDRLKLRVILAVQGRSTGGTAARYRFITLSVSTRVADAVVYRDGLSPVVNVAVFAADNNGVADATLLAQVAAALNADDVRMVNDTISVRSAVIQVVNVAANVWLLPNTTSAILDTVAADLPATWIAESGLGRDLTISWLISKIMVAGVQRVEITAPAATVVMPPYQAVRIGTVTLTNMGRDY